MCSPENELANFCLHKIATIKDAKVTVVIFQGIYKNGIELIISIMFGLREIVLDVSDKAQVGTLLVREIFL